MSRHIDTIPVWDAYKADCECPLCVLMKKNEEDYVENFLGASVMEPDRRVEVNEKGFCRRHFKMMFEAGNRLGLALMTDTYMKRTLEKLQKNAEGLLDAAREEGQKGLLARMGKKSADIPAAAQEIKSMTCSCILCDRLNAAMERYVYTLLYMYAHEAEFKKAVAESKGFCLDHYAQVLEEAPKHLSGRDLQQFIETTSKIELENIQRVEKDLEWFTLKFDYRNRDKPWGNSQDAVERSLNKMRGGAV